MGVNESVKCLPLSERDTSVERTTTNTTKSTAQRIQSYSRPALAHEVKRSAESNSFAVLFMLSEPLRSLYAEYVVVDTHSCEWSNCIVRQKTIPKQPPLFINE